MDPFTHIKSVLAIVLGLSLAHLIQASLNLLLQRGKKKPYWVHMLWVYIRFSADSSFLVVGIQSDRD